MTDQRLSPAEIEARITGMDGGGSGPRASKTDKERVTELMDAFRRKSEVTEPQRPGPPDDSARART